MQSCIERIDFLRRGGGVSRTPFSVQSGCALRPAVFSKNRRAMNPIETLIKRSTLVLQARKGAW